MTLSCKILNFRIGNRKCYTNFVPVARKYRIHSLVLNFPCYPFYKSPSNTPLKHQPLKMQFPSSLCLALMSIPVILAVALPNPEHNIEITINIPVRMIEVPPPLNKPLGASLSKKNMQDQHTKSVPFGLGSKRYCSALHCTYHVPTLSIRYLIDSYLFPSIRHLAQVLRFLD